MVARVMMPQDANLAGNVFGGTILKFVDEVAYVVATRHVRANVVTASLDQTSFLSPVHIGDLLTLRASVNAVWRSSLEIGVRVEAEDPKTGDVRHTGSSYLTIVALDSSGQPCQAPDLILETDEDRRRHEEACLRREQRLEERRGEESK